LTIWSKSLQGWKIRRGRDELRKTQSADPVERVVALARAEFAGAVDETTMSTVKITDEPEALLHRYEAGLRRYLSAVAPCICATTNSTSKGSEI